MPRFKDLKKRAKVVLKRSYLLLVIAALVYSLLGVGGYSISQKVIETYNSANVKDRSLVSAATGFTASSDQEYVNKILEGKIDELNQEAQFSDWENKSGVAKSGIGGKRGNISSVLSFVNSGSMLVTIINFLFGIFKDGTVVGIILAILAALIAFALFFYIGNVLKVWVNRVFLEASTYRKVPVTNAFTAIRARKWHRTSATMLLTYIFQQLWWLTIVGGFIKTYSYLMVPYIIAENPEIKPRTAITLSRKMMNGHKWEAFKLQISFIGWVILSLLTLGLLDIFFVSPYYESTIAEYYKELRRLAKENNIENADLLNDPYLFDKGTPEVLEKAYPDIVDGKEILSCITLRMTKVQKFLTKWLGIWIGSKVKKDIIEEYECISYRVECDEAEIAGESYPMRLDRFAKQKQYILGERVSWMRLYDVFNVVAFFFIFGFIGWAWEVFLHLVNDHQFINRGALHGPWLPIYAVGGMLIVVVLNRAKKKPWLLFVLTLLLCAAVEYCTAKYLEDCNLIRYWNYRGYFLNLDGRICFEGIMLFGILGMLAVYLIGPFLDKTLSKISRKVFIPIVLAFVVIFISDTIYSHFVPNQGAGISQPLCAGGWPTTFTVEDNLKITEEEEAELRSDIDDVEVLQKFGIYPLTMDEIEEYQNNGTVDELRKEAEIAEEKIEQEKEKREQEAQEQ